MNLIKKDGKLVKFDKSKISEAALKTSSHAEIYDTYMDLVNAAPNDISSKNANMNPASPAGMMMKFASESSKSFVDDCLLSEESRYYVDNNYIHIHDKDYYPTKSLTGLQQPLDLILANGFSARHGSIKPAERIEEAAIMGFISMEQIQNEMHGGQSIPAFDFYLAPYVRLSYIEEIKKIENLLEIDLNDIYQLHINDYIERPLGGLNAYDKFIQQAINNTINRVHQAMEAFFHNMNTIHDRGGNQSVFSSINYGTDTSSEGRCIIKELLKSACQSIENGEIPTAPIHIWKKKSGVNYLPEDRNYDLYKLACEIAAKSSFPNFLNLDATYNQHEDWDINDPRRFEKEVATMGCRIRVFEDRHGKKTSIGRGNLSFTTINIVKLALECREIDDVEKKKKEFYKKLQKCIDVAAEQLYDRYLFQSSAVKKQFPMLMSGMWTDSENLNCNDNVRNALKHGTLSVGFIGLAEALIALTGKHHGESDDAQKLGLEIVKFMHCRIKEKADFYDLNYSLLASPADGLARKLVKADKKQFGEIAKITDREYYTNSSHLPAWYKCPIEHKAKIEAAYHEFERGGHIFNVELDGNTVDKPSAIMKIVDIMDKYNIGYGSVNHTKNRSKFSEGSTR